MSADATHSQDPVVSTVLHDPAHDAGHHAEEKPHDHAEEIAHIKQHAIENMRWFAGFFSLILLTVANYEFYGTENIWGLVILTTARCLLIACFLNWLFHGFSLVFRTFIFCIIFLAGMIFLSWWDSALPQIGDPIKDRINPVPPPSHVP